MSLNFAKVCAPACGACLAGRAVGPALTRAETVLKPGNAGGLQKLFISISIPDATPGSAAVVRHQDARHQHAHGGERKTLRSGR